jgi:hypothetical protein
VPSARPAIFTKRSTAPAATWRTGSRSVSSIFMPFAPRPPPCGQTSCACGLPPWPMCCCALCAASPAHRDGAAGLDWGSARIGLRHCRLHRLLRCGQHHRYTGDARPYQQGHLAGARLTRSAPQTARCSLRDSSRQSPGNCAPDKRDEARDLLAPVYGWFTEGFDTLDLKEAKNLLEQLA